MAFFLSIVLLSLTVQVELKESVKHESLFDGGNIFEDSIFKSNSPDSSVAQSLPNIFQLFNEQMSSNVNGNSSEVMSNEYIDQSPEYSEEQRQEVSPLLSTLAEPATFENLPISEISDQITQETIKSKIRQQLNQRFKPIRRKKRPQSTTSSSGLVQSSAGENTDNGQNSKSKDNMQEETALSGKTYGSPPDDYVGQRKPYHFAYAVKNKYGNNFNQEESSDGNTITGQYKVLLPDGRIQTVAYIADWKHGYNAVVTYEGGSKNQDQYDKPESPAPVIHRPVGGQLKIEKLPGIPPVLIKTVHPVTQNRFANGGFPNNPQVGLPVGNPGGKVGPQLGHSVINHPYPPANHQSNPPPNRHSYPPSNHHSYPPSNYYSYPPSNHHSYPPVNNFNRPIQQQSPRQPHIEKPFRPSSPDKSAWQPVNQNYGFPTPNFNFNSKPADLNVIYGGGRNPHQVGGPNHHGQLYFQQHNYKVNHPTPGGYSQVLYRQTIKSSNSGYDSVANYNNNNLRYAQQFPGGLPEPTSPVPTRVPPGGQMSKHPHHIDSLKNMHVLPTGTVPQYANHGVKSNVIQTLAHPIFGPIFSNQVNPTFNPNLIKQVNPTNDPNKFKQVNPTFDPNNIKQMNPTFDPNSFKQMNPTFDPNNFKQMNPTFDPNDFKQVMPTFESMQVRPTMDPNLVNEQNINSTYESNMVKQINPTINPNQVNQILPSFEPTSHAKQIVSVNPTIDPRPATQQGDNKDINPTYEPMKQSSPSTFSADSIVQQQINPTFVPNLAEQQLLLANQQINNLQGASPLEFGPAGFATLNNNQNEKKANLPTVVVPIASQLPPPSPTVQTYLHPHFNPILNPHLNFVLSKYPNLIPHPDPNLKTNSHPVTQIHPIILSSRFRNTPRFHSKYKGNRVVNQKTDEHRIVNTKTGGHRLESPKSGGDRIVTSIINFNPHLNSNFSPNLNLVSSEGIINPESTHNSTSKSRPESVETEAESHQHSVYQMHPDSNKQIDQAGAMIPKNTSFYFSAVIPNPMNSTYPILPLPKDFIAKSILAHINSLRTGNPIPAESVIKSIVQDAGSPAIHPRMNVLPPPITLISTTPTTSPDPTLATTSPKTRYNRKILPQIQLKVSRSNELDNAERLQSEHPLNESKSTQISDDVTTTTTTTMIPNIEGAMNNQELMLLHLPLNKTRDESKETDVPESEDKNFGLKNVVTSTTVNKDKFSNVDNSTMRAVRENFIRIKRIRLRKPLTQRNKTAAAAVK